MKFLLLSTLVVFTSCSHMSHQMNGMTNKAAEKYQVSQIENDKVTLDDGKIRIEFEEYSKIVDRVQSKITNEMLKESDAKKLLSSIPKGGFAHVYIFRDTVDTANTKWFSYVIHQNGKEIQRILGMTGTDSVPTVPSHWGIDGRYWTNIESIPLKETFKDSDTYEVFVIDKLSNGRDQFKITYKPVENIRSTASSKNK